MKANILKSYAHMISNHLLDEHSPFKVTNICWSANKKAQGRYSGTTDFENSQKHFHSLCSLSWHMRTAACKVMQGDD